MSKKPSLKLFKLIKSMTPSEKRYFKVYASNHRSNNVNKYFQLFDAIDSQKKYDDGALKEVIYEGEQLQSKKFPELKSYLFESILKSLQAYDEKTSVDYKIKGLLSNVKVLYNRSHYVECKEYLAKARKLAIKYEAFIDLLEILDWKKRIAYTLIDIPFLDKELKNIEEEEKNYLSHLQNIADYKHLFFEIYFLVKKEAFIRSEKKLPILNEFKNHLLLQNLSTAKSHRAKILYYRIRSLYYSFVLKYKKFYSYNKELIMLMESAPHFLKEDVSEYISAYSNLALSCGLLKNYQECNEVLESLHNITPLTYDDELKIQRQYYFLKMSIAKTMGEFEIGLQTINDMQKISKKYKFEFFEPSTMYFQYFHIHFGLEDYDSALDYLNKLINIPKSDINKQDLKSIARILNLFIHFELGNHLLLESLLRSTYRFLKERQRLYEFEKEVIRFITKAEKIQTRKELEQLFKELRVQFKKLSEVPSEKAMLNYFDFDALLVSKITNKSFAEVVRSKIKTTL